MDFAPSDRVASLLERVREFMEEHVDPVEREAMEALDAEVRPGVPYPEILVDLRNVKSVRLPLRKAGRHRRERFQLSVTSDGETALGLRQLEPGRLVKVDGRRAGRAGPRGRVTVRLGARQHTVAL